MNISELPTINRIGTRIATLERKEEHLENRIDRGQGSAASLEFDRTELLAVREALRALKLHRSLVERMPNAFTVLRELVAMDPPGSPELQALVARAVQVLEDYRGFEE